MKTLQDYLHKRRITQQQFADQLGVSKGLVGQWLNGETRITAERALQIERATRGEVKRQQLRPELYRGMSA